MASALAEIAPRIARAIEQEKVHRMRGIHRCSCGFGWRIDGHEYDTGGCIEDLERAQRRRDRFEASDALDAKDGRT